MVYSFQPLSEQLSMLFMFCSNMMFVLTMEISNSQQTHTSKIFKKKLSLVLHGVFIYCSPSRAPIVSITQTVFDHEG